MAQLRSAALVALLAASALALASCITFRPASSDQTRWEEMPNDPRPELWVQGTPRLRVVFDGVYTGMDDAEPAFDAPSTDYYLGVLRKARLFEAVLERGADPGPDPARVRVTRRFEEDSHLAGNLSQAVTVPGLLGYRFGLVAVYRLELERPGAETAVYEARSRLVQIYYAAGRADEARLLLHREADRANTQALLHQLHADPTLFEGAPPEAL